jgi:hypothetical protein
VIVRRLIPVFAYAPSDDALAFAGSTSPVVSSIDPAEISRGVTAVVTITGTNFEDGATVTVPGSNIFGYPQAGAVYDTTYVGPTELTVILFAIPGATLTSHDFTVTQSGGSDTLSDGIAVADFPAFSDLGPLSRGSEVDTDASAMTAADVEVPAGSVVIAYLATQDADQVVDQIEHGSQALTEVQTTTNESATSKLLAACYAWHNNTGASVTADLVASRDAGTWEKAHLHWFVTPALSPDWQGEIASSDVSGAPPLEPELTHDVTAETDSIVLSMFCELDDVNIPGNGVVLTQHLSTGGIGASLSSAMMINDSVSAGDQTVYMRDEEENAYSCILLSVVIRGITVDSPRPAFSPLLREHGTIRQKLEYRSGDSYANNVVYVARCSGVPIAIQPSVSIESRQRYAEGSRGTFNVYLPAGQTIERTDRIVPEDGTYADQQFEVTGDSRDFAGVGRGQMVTVEAVSDLETHQTWTASGPTTYRHLLKVTATVSRKTETVSSDSYGLSTSWENVTSGVVCAIQPRGTRESRLRFAEGNESEYEGFFEHGTDLKRSDRIIPESGTYAGKTLSVVSDPVDMAGRGVGMVVQLEEVSDAGQT